MSKMSEIDFCIGELRTAAKSLTAVADSLKALFGASAAPAGKSAQSGNGNAQMTNADTRQYQRRQSECYEVIRAKAEACYSGTGASRTRRKVPLRVTPTRFGNCCKSTAQ